MPAGDRIRPPAVSCAAADDGGSRSVSPRNVIGESGPVDDANPHLRAAPGFLIRLQRSAAAGDRQGQERRVGNGAETVRSESVRAFVSNSNFHVINCHAIVCTCITQ